MVVIGGITYFTIVLGELVPKTIALNNPEKIALFAVPVIKVFSKVVFPFIRLLSLSTKLILRLLGIKETNEENVSEEELRFILKVAGKEGVLESEESQAMQNLITFTDQNARSLMTHISEVEWINYESSKDEIYEKVKESVHSKFLVCEENVDNVKGLLNSKDLLENLKNPTFSLNQILTQPIYIMLNTSAFQILDAFKDRKQYLGVVVDQYGSVQGIITLHDLIEAIVGDLPDEDETDDDDNIKVRSTDGYLINGRTPIWELNQYFSQVLIDNKGESYATISGFLINQLKSMPKEGEVVEHNRYIFEILDMDGVRIDNQAGRAGSGRGNIIMSKFDSYPLATTNYSRLGSGQRT